MATSSVTSVRLTVPVGLPVDPVTAAVMFTLAPYGTGFGANEMATVAVLAPSTFCVKALEEDAAYDPSPLELATTVKAPPALPVAGGV